MLELHVSVFSLSYKGVEEKNNSLTFIILKCLVVSNLLHTFASDLTTTKQMRDMTKIANNMKTPNTTENTCPELTFGFLKSLATVVWEAHSKVFCGHPDANLNHLNVKSMINKSTNTIAS